MIRRAMGVVCMVGVCSLLIGCASVTADRGIENTWRDPNVAHWEAGKTTQQDVLDALGPPSQLISLNDETVFYYLLEEARTKVMILIFYNQAKSNVTYDRAMFIFDKQGVLTKFSVSKPPADSKKKK